MLKSIKISVNTLLIVSAATSLLVLSLFGILRFSFIQTYLFNGVSRYIAQDIQSTISVSKVEFAFFNRIVLNDLLIRDRNNDTMIFSSKITAGIRQLGLKNGLLKFGRVNVDRPVVALITDSTGQMNLTWYLDLLTRNSDTTEKERKTRISINTIDLQGGRFALINRNNEGGITPIDFSNLKLDSIFAVVNRFSVTSDSVSMNIGSLKFNESTGFHVKAFSSNFSIIGRTLKFNDISLLSEKSKIVADHVYLLAGPASSFSNFTSEIPLDISLDNSYFYSSDLKYFISFLKEYDESFWLSGQVRGTISELKGRNIKISYRDETILDMDFDLSGLPDLANTFIFLEINDFRSVSGDIEQFNIPGKGNLMVPDKLRELGVVSFSGTFTGFTTDFVTYGKINTNKGIISTDISLRPEEKERYRIRGIIKGNEIDLSTFASRDLLGKMTMVANVDGYTEGFKKYFVSLNGRIDSIEINNYKYRNIALNGSFNDKSWDGDIKVEDKNIKMELLGMLDFSRDLPEFDFTLNLSEADLFNLHIAREDTSAAASLLLTANFKGNNLDNLDGEIKLLNSKFRKYSRDMELFDFSLRTSSRNSVPSISLRTDFIDATLDGHYSFSGLKNYVSEAISGLIPSKYSRPSKVISSEVNRFNFDINFKNTDRLNDFFRTGLNIAQNSRISGIVNTDSLLLVTGSSKLFSFRNNTFNDLIISASYSDTVADITLKSSGCDLSGLANLKNLSSELKFIPDEFNISLIWDNKEKDLNSGNISANGKYLSSAVNGRPPVLQVMLAPGDIYIKNKLLKIDPASIISDTTSLKITNFRVGDPQNYIAVNGSASNDINDTIVFSFNGININPLNNLYEKRMNYDPEMIRLSLGGTVNGVISFTDIYRNFMFESDIIIRDFTLLESTYGNISIQSAWNNENKLIDINAGNNFEGVKMFEINGTYDPADRNAILRINTDKMPLGVLNPLLKSFASGINGTASGRVLLTGEPSKPVITGSLKADNASFKVDYLQTRYSLSDSIRFDRSGIKFNKVVLSDERNNFATLDGTVSHQYFKDFGVDITVRPVDCMVLNTKAKDNDLFYGTAFASGVTTIKTSDQVITFDISAKTGRNTRFFIPLNSGMSVSENSFVTFIGEKNETSNDEQGTKSKAPDNEETVMEIDFDLEVTPDAEVQLIMDPTAGDIMKGKGTGNLNMSLDRKGEFKIYGDYLIETGDYLFTLGNIINKSFSVEHGGMINFNGDVENADINIKAIYKTKASLYDIRPDMLDEKLKERIPVECQLLLTGKLYNPVVGFDIYLPTADEETRAYLKSMIKSDEDMSRQFLFLLVMNSFYADPMAGTGPSGGSLGTGSVVGVTTMEMLSNQLSNWLSQISNDFDIGVLYMPGSTSVPNSQELQVALSTQLLNDRVIINGNFDVAGTSARQAGNTTSASSSQFTGAFDVEYKINEKIRFKFFNRSNDNFYNNTSSDYTQGIGLFYRQDFNKLKDLFIKPEKSSARRVDK